MESLSLFMESFIKRFFMFFLFIALIVVGVPSIVIFSQPHDFNHSLDLSAHLNTQQTLPVSSTNKINQALKPTQPALSASNLISLGWISGNGQQVTQYNDLQVVSPLFATIDGSYKIHQTQSSSVSTLQKQGKKVWGRVTLNAQSNTATHQFLSDSKGMDQAIKSLVSTALQSHLDGLNIDIEQIPIQDRTVFSQFIQNLSVQTKKDHLNLSVDLQPEPTSTPTSNKAFNQVIAQSCDYVVFMGYDYHWSTDTTPGPVTSLQWLETNVKQFVQNGIPSEKFILGLPTYSRIWQVNSNGQTVTSMALSNEYVNSLMQQENRPITWDPSQANYYTTYSKNGKSYKVWLTNNRSLLEYLNLVTKYHLGGAGFWSLDNISTAVWNQLVDNFDKTYSTDL